MGTYAWNILYSKILPAKSGARRRRPAAQAAPSQAVHWNLATGPYQLHYYYGTLKFHQPSMKRHPGFSMMYKKKKCLTIYLHGLLQLSYVYNNYLVTSMNAAKNWGSSYPKFWLVLLKVGLGKFWLFFLNWLNPRWFYGQIWCRIQIWQNSWPPVMSDVAKFQKFKMAAKMT